ncbi:MAG: DedA family protein [Psychromonas sp.]|nr:DedA family protein [Psychromonas sp.]
MKIFSPLYDKALVWSKHKHAASILYLIAFVEAIFWPIPVDIMLVPMAIATRDKAWRYAAGVTFFSVFGGAFGYYLGHVLYGPVVHPFIEFMGYQDKLAMAQNWFSKWGVMVIFIASFTPIPFKIFTLTAGIINMAFLPFILTALIGRSLRFFLVSGLVVIGGEKMADKLSRYIDVLGWITIIVAIIFYFSLKN